MLFPSYNGMTSFPLTNSYFSRWLLHHQAGVIKDGGWEIPAEISFAGVVIFQGKITGIFWSVANPGGWLLACWTTIFEMFFSRVTEMMDFSGDGSDFVPAFWGCFRSPMEIFEKWDHHESQEWGSRSTEKAIVGMKKIGMKCLGTISTSTWSTYILSRITNRYAWNKQGAVLQDLRHIIEWDDIYKVGFVQSQEAEREQQTNTWGLQAWTQTTESNTVLSTTCCLNHLHCRFRSA